MSILSMENVNYSYEKMNKKVLRNVSVDFEEGTMYAIVGNSREVHYARYFGRTRRSFER